MILFNWPRLMKLFSTVALIFCAGLSVFSVAAQEAPAWEVQALSKIIPGTVEGKMDYDPVNGTASGTNGVYIKYGNATLTADSASLNTQSGEVVADGHVRIESADQLWVGDHIRYNFKTRQMRSEQFRTGKWPVFASGIGLTGNASNRVYYADNAAVTTDDTADPAFQVRASRIKIIPGKSVEMWNAILYAEGVPAFYFPYYKHNLGPRANNFTFAPGFRSTYGGFLLNTYNWFAGTNVDGKIHVDYRLKRGVGAGPDVNAHLGEWGEVGLKYYYLNDHRPNTSTNAFPQYGNIPQNRQILNFNWQATPATNLNLKALVNYDSDPLVLHDFREGEYADNPQPNTFIEANKYWDNWSLDALTTPRINSYFNQVERLPDVRLTGFQQQVLDTPVYYDSESSAGWYRQFTTYTNGLYQGTNGFYANSAARADTYHQFTLPWTFFHWLNVAPRVGGRLTYYSAQNITNGAPNRDVYRGVFNTGVGTSFKASQLWVNATNGFLQVDGLRHIIEPSANYVFVPDPSTPPAKLPQFDGEQPSLLELPVLFPDYNNIDSIDTQNVIRFGVRNTLQTMRDGQLDKLVDWNMQLDWRLHPMAGQNTLNDLYSTFAFKPRTWLIAESQTRYDLDDGQLNMTFQQLTFAPNDRWSWGLGYWYLRGGTWGNSSWTENNLITSTFFVRLGDNWGGRLSQNYNAVTQRLQDQMFTIYRDLRSWTSALTLRVANNTGGQADVTIAIVFSLKASPSLGVGEDVANRYRLVGE
jgi:lipopolysaccharide assembly outer membrane protein LptD (OstA)